MSTHKIVDYILTCPEELDRLVCAIIANSKFQNAIGSAITNLSSQQLTLLAQSLCQPLQCECEASGPSAVDDTADTQVDTPITVDVLANDLPSSKHCLLDATTVVITKSPVNGTTTVDEVTGAITYTPNAGFVGSDMLVYKVEDNCCNCDEACLIINVADANTPPVCSSTTVIMTQATSTTVDLLGLVTQGTCSIDTFTMLVGALNGTATINGTTLEYTPDPLFVGFEDVTITVTDTCGETCELTVTFEVQATTYDDPVCINDVVVMTYNQVSTTIDVLSNDLTDPLCPIDPNSLALISTPAFGQVVVDNGQLTYSPPSGWIGEVTFTYRVTDGCGASCTANVRVVVQAPCGNTVVNCTTVAGPSCNIIVFTLDTALVCPDTNRVLLYVQNAQGFVSPFPVVFNQISGTSVSVLSTAFTGLGGATCEDVVSICCASPSIDPDC